MARKGVERAGVFSHSTKDGVMSPSVYLEQIWNLDLEAEDPAQARN